MYVVIVIFFLFALFLIYTSREKKYKLLLGNKSYICTYDDLLFILLLAMLFFVWILKSSYVGVDTNMYRYMYNVANGYVEEGLSWNWAHQPLYYVLFFIFERMGLSFRSAQVVFYFFACTGLYILFKKNSKNKVLALFLFVTCESLALYSSALRQMIAITFGIYAIQFTYEKKIWKALVTIVCAILMHKSACVLLILLILYFYIPTKKQLLLFSPCIWIGALLLPKEIIIEAAMLLGYNGYLQNIGISSDVLLIMMYVCMGVFTWYMMYITKWDTMRLRYFTTLFVIGIAIMLFSSKFYLISRIQYYFQAAQYLIFAEAIQKLNNKKSVMLFVLIIILYVLFFVFSLDSDTLSITPYKFFWKAGEKWS